MKKKSLTFSRLASLLLCAFLFSCVKAPPKTSFDTASREHAEKILSALRQDSQKIKGLKAYAQVRVEGGGKVETFDAAILVNPPKQLRIEILDDLGQTKARLRADGSQVVFEDMQRGTEDTLEQSDKVLQKTLHLPIPIDEFIARMLLQIPETALLGIEKSSLGKDAPEQESLVLENFELEVAPLSPRLVGVKKNKGPGIYQIAYRNYSENLPEPYPQEISWSFKNPRIEIRMSLKDFATHEAISPSKFQAASEAEGTDKLH